MRYLALLLLLLPCTCVRAQMIQPEKGYTPQIGVVVSMLDDLKELKGKPIKFYLDLWDEVRAETHRLLKTKDDKWFNRKAGDSRNMNNHWAWYHVMEHQANHMGQIRLILGRVK